jgi:putative membrane protein
VNKLEQLDIDVRFLLANERTLLAWIRTALAIEAGGLALLQLHKHHSYVGIFVLLLGAFVALIGYSRFKSTDKAIREHRLPHAGHGPEIQVAIVVGTAILLAIAQVTFLR